MAGLTGVIGAVRRRQTPSEQRTADEDGGLRQAGIAMHQAGLVAGSRIMSTKAPVPGYCMTAIWSHGPLSPIRTWRTSL